MCNSPATRALKAQRKTERYNRKIERYNRRHGIYNDDGNNIAQLLSTNIVLHSSAVEAKEDVRNSDVTCPSPPSYCAVMEKERSEAVLDGVGTMVQGGHGDVVAGTERCSGGGCCGRKGGCGGRKRGGLVTLLFRLVKKEYAAYKESKGVSDGGAGGEMVRSEKY